MKENQVVKRVRSFLQDVISKLERVTPGNSAHQCGAAIGMLQNCCYILSHLSDPRAGNGKRKGVSASGALESSPRSISDLLEEARVDTMELRQHGWSVDAEMVERMATILADALPVLRALKTQHESPCSAVASNSVVREFTTFLKAHPAALDDAETTVVDKEPA